MKKIAALVITVFSVFALHAQTVSSLSETFNASCATTGANYPLYWTEWNIIPPTSALAWTCTPAGGRDATPGILCNSYISGIHYVDTAWLFTPKLDLSGFSDSVYLRFDSRYDISAGRLQLLINPNFDTLTNPNDTALVHTWMDLSVANRLSPVIGPDDSANWVTHYINLTSFKSTPLYVAFRYASSSSVGGTWTIDNVFLTPWGLNVPTVTTKTMKMSILGTSTTSKISFAADYPNAGNYNVYLYDNIGRQVHKSTFFTTAGNNTQTINGLALTPGIYFLKVGDINNYSVANTIIE